MPTGYDVIQAKVDAAYAKWQQKDKELSALLSARAADTAYADDVKAIAVISAKAAANNGVALATDKNGDAVPPSTKTIKNYYGADMVWAYTTGGIYLSGTDSAAGRNYVASIDNAINVKVSEVKKADDDYKQAQKDLAKYESSSPVAAAISAATVSGTKATQKRKDNIYYIGGFLLLLILTYGIYRATRTKKETTTT